MARRRQRGNGRGSLFQREPGGAWIAKWYDHAGHRQERSTRTNDKRAAERLLAHWATAATLRREGAIDARAEGLAAQARRPIEEHLKDFETALRAKGASDKHAELLLTRARKVMEGAKIRTWGDASASRAVEYLHELRTDREVKDEAGNVAAVRRGISAQTFNFYLQAVKQFGRWMVKDRRAADNPFAYLEPLNVKLDRRHDRRAFTVDELRRLLTAAGNGPDVRGMSGPDRAMLYRVTVETGLRAGELRSLTRASFDFESEPPTVTVGAAYSKRRREDTLPLRPKTADALARHVATLAPAAHVFKMPETEHLAQMLREDLAAAGIPYRDDAGRVADFHALRHTFITNLATGGVHPKTAQALARHSTITLTMDRYTHQRTGDDAAALEVLPDLSVAAAVAQAEGTHDAPVDADHRRSMCPTSSPTSSRAKGRVPSAARRDDRVPAAVASGGAADGDNSHVGNSLPRSAATRRDGMRNGGGGIRTPGTLAGTAVFKTAPFSHSGTPPGSRKLP